MAEGQAPGRAARGRAIDLKGEPGIKHPARRRHVALISDSAGVGGAEIYATVLAEALRDRYRFTAMTPDLGPGTESRRLFAESGIETRTVHGLSRRPSPMVLHRLGSQLRAVDPDLVHVNLSDQGAGTTVLLAALRFRRPTVATLHLLVPDLSVWRERLAASIMKRLGAVIAVSGPIAAWLKGKGATASLVPNGLPEPQLVPGAREALDVRAGNFAVGGIGRLHGQKGWDLFCDAAALVRARLPRTDFVVIGEGEERDRLASRESCGAVRFLGYRSRASSLLGAFDLLAIPSRYEGLPLTAVEAMLSGLPVVAARVGGLPEAIGDTGVLVPPEDAEALAQAIISLAEDPGRRAKLGERARLRARKRFGIQRMAAETESIYESVLRGADVGVDAAVQ